MENLMRPVAALLLATTFAGPALAGGPTVVEPEPVIAAPPAAVPASYDWSGFYAGAQIGYGDISTDPAVLEGDGLLGGIHAGYRFDFGQFVAGAELD
jgi:opacity protein-like surface antigen